MRKVLSAGLEVLYRVAGLQLFDNLASLMGTTSRSEDGGLLANGLVRRMAIHELGPFVPTRDPALQVLADDCIMPLMSGRELSERMVSIRPEIRVVFMSAYSNNLLSNQQGLDPKHVFLQKPFRLATVGRQVRDVLGRSQVAAAAGK